MKHTPKPDTAERLEALEEAVAALGERLNQAGNFSPGPVFSPGFQSPAISAQTSFPLAVPSLLFASPLAGAQPVVFPAQPLKGTCAKAMATITLPGPGNYYLTVTVDESSDCSVVISSLVPNFGPVAPSTSETFYFPYFTDKLIAKCQGKGRCQATVQLVKLS